MTATVTKVLDVQRLGERLTIVTVQGPKIDVPEGAAQVPYETYEVIANLQDDGTPRWEVGELCIYISEGSIIPEDVLKERGYWNEEKDRGYLDGSKNNRVKGRVMAKNPDGTGGHRTEGLLFKAGRPKDDWSDPPANSYWIDRGNQVLDVQIGDDVSAFFGINKP